MKPYKNKINRIRTFALALIFIGIVIMYVGIYFRNQPIVMVILMLLATDCNGHLNAAWCPRNYWKYRCLCLDWVAVHENRTS